MAKYRIIYLRLNHIASAFYPVKIGINPIGLSASMYSG